MTEINYLEFTSPTATEIDKPLIVDNPKQFHWDDHCDMLVIGGGLAGVSTALRGAERGLDIILADRFCGGGTSALSGGVVYAGGGTRVQHECDVEDSVIALADYLKLEIGDLISSKTVEKFAANSPAMIDWLEQQGVQFSGPLARKKTSYPSATEFLYYSGNETVADFAGTYPPAPRGHRAYSDDPLDNKKFSGEIMMGRLYSRIASTSAIRFKQQTSARRLIVDAEGQVIGAELCQLPAGRLSSRMHAKLYDVSKRVMISILGISEPIWKLLSRIERKHAKPIRIRAKQGVVLATGGYVNNRRMVERTAPAYIKVGVAGNLGDDGSALRLAQGLNTLPRQMHLLSAWRFVNPPYSWMKGVVVSHQGQRILNEEKYGARMGDAMFQKADGMIWLVVDSAVQAAAKYDLDNDPMLVFQRLPAKAVMKLAKSAPTIAALEAKLQLPMGSLTTVVDAYNQAIKTNSNDPMGKSHLNRQALTKGPFYAMDMSYNNRLNPVAGITLGGLEVDEQSGAVRTASGNAISGLYAAGRAAMGLCSANYVSGLSLADCVFSGLRAAENIADNKSNASQADSSQPALLQGNLLWQQLHRVCKVDDGVVLVVDSATHSATVTRRDLLKQGQKLASCLQKLGVGAGDVIALQLPSWQQWAWCAVAAAALDAVLLPIWPAYGAKELKFILDDASAKVLITPDVWKNINFRERVQATGETAQTIIHLTINDIDELLAEKVAAWEPEQTNSKVAMAALLIYTSGTTSNPKGVIHTTASILAEIESLKFNKSGVRLCPWPLGHIAGALEIYRLLCGGASLVLMEQWDASVAAKLIETHNITATSGTGYHLSTLLDAAADSGANISTINDFMVGAAPIPAAIIQRSEALGIQTYRCYGATEHPTISSGSPDDPLSKRLTTEGRLLPGVKVLILDDNDQPLPLGEEGEIATRGPDRCFGYLHSALNDSVFTEDGWYRTGDIGSLDAESYLKVVDRKKDIIIRGGSNISSREVEDVLILHPDIADVAVVAAAHPTLGEIACAVVVLCTDKTLSLEGVSSWFTAQKIARFKTPEKLMLMTELPRNTTGKVLKKELRVLVNNNT